MVTYAVLDATGNCGTALIDNLLRKRDDKINAYCRNKTKLIQKVPEIANNKRVRVFEGSIYDIDLLSVCICNTPAIFHVVTTNDNIPGCHVGLDTAKSIIAALEKLKIASQLTDPLPRILFLSCGTIDDHLSLTLPWWFRPILRTAASHVYEDLRRTEAYQEFSHTKANIICLVTKSFRTSWT